MTSLVAGRTPSHVSGQPQQVNWAIGLCEIGNCGSCFYSCLFPCCAIASARHELDGSNWFVNCCCIGTAAARYLVRTGYGIEGTAQWDCCTSLFCSCCAVNQLYQTVKQKGKIPLEHVGPDFNKNKRTGMQRRPCFGVIYDLSYTLLCLPCATGYLLESSGIPCWFGACCVSPLGAVSIHRYRRRLEGNCGGECLEDCLFPAICGGISQYLAMPWICRAVIEENVYVDRPNCCYGCDLIGLCSYSCAYVCDGCKCQSREGRYLISDA
mmetsp:Transcript_7826/g.5871  ORF Transcript_7826/g.5871 Transcript_7826/m.5871 type:complete len:267 (-) Transcript_7826:85-885(-)